MKSHKVMAKFEGKTLFITGASRGIGRAIALKAAKERANVVIAAKTAEEHPKLKGTIYSVAAEVEALGGKALPIQCDIRDESQIQEAVTQAVKAFDSLDILINNASAIHLASTLETPLKRFDLMLSVNIRGAFATTQACLPYLKQASNPHVLMLSPPLSLEPKWFTNHCAYTLSKYGMSLCVLGMAEEFKEEGIAFNALWPRTIIATAAVDMLGGEAFLQASRSPEIVADAALYIFQKKSSTCSGQFFIDEDVLRAEGITDFSAYSIDPTVSLKSDLFLD